MQLSSEELETLYAIRNYATERIDHKMMGRYWVSDNTTWAVERDREFFTRAFSVPWDADYNGAMMLGYVNALLEGV